MDKSTTKTTVPRKSPLSLYQALKFHKEEEVKTILKSYGSTEIKAATDIMTFMRKTENLKHRSMHLTPLEAALRLGNTTICQLLINEGAASLPINKNKNLLRHAFEAGNFKVAMLLLKVGANIWIEDEGMLPLYFALNNKTCPEDIVKIMVEAGFRPDEVIHKPNRQTALHIAAMMNHLSVVEYLLSELKVKPDVKDILGKAPLHYSTENNNHTITEMLDIYGAKLETECDRNFSPLFYMIAEGKLETVKRLLSLGADIHHATGQQMSLSPLHMATLAQDLNIVKLLLEREANVDLQIPETGQTAVHLAAGVKLEFYDEHTAKQIKILLDCIIRLLIKERANLSLRDAFGWTPLQAAVTANNISSAKLLVENGSQLNEGVENKAGSQIPFHTVALSCDKDLIDLCLEYGADNTNPNDEGLYPAQSIVMMKMLAAGNSLTSSNSIQSGDRTEDNCSGVFRTFVKHGFPYELLTRILWRPDLGPKPQYPREVMELISKQVMLFTGIRQNQLKHVKTAIKNLQAEVKAISFEVPYPIHFLASKGSNTILEQILLEGAAKVNVVNAHGITPLHLAAAAGHKECCLTLLAYGAVYNPSNAKCRETPLQMARKNGHVNVVNILRLAHKPFGNLRAGISYMKSVPLREKRPFLNCVNRSGKTLLALALENNLHDLAQELITLRINDPANVK